MADSARAPTRPLAVVRGACPHDCPDTCAWEVTVDAGRAVGLRGVKEHPRTRGGLCAKIADGAEVRAFDGRGSVRARARVGYRVHAGVVALPSGWWPSLSPGGTSANTLTPARLTDLGGGAAFRDAMVEAGRLGAPS